MAKSYKTSSRHVEIEKYLFFLKKKRPINRLKASKVKINVIPKGGNERGKGLFKRSLKSAWETCKKRVIRSCSWE